MKQKQKQGEDLCANEPVLPEAVILSGPYPPDQLWQPMFSAVVLVYEDPAAPQWFHAYGIDVTSKRIVFYAIGHKENDLAHFQAQMLRELDRAEVVDGSQFGDPEGPRPILVIVRRTVQRFNLVIPTKDPPPGVTSESLLEDAVQLIRPTS
jgi:hypothetical protein